MYKLTLAASAAAFALSSTAMAQSAQDRLDARYDRALAAGYKALFLCSGLAIAERNGTTRTPEQIQAWELTGIYPKLDPIIRGLDYEIVRRPSGQIAHVQVAWADDMPDRVAVYYDRDIGCSVLPVGAPEDISQPELSVEAEQEAQPEPESSANNTALEMPFSAAFDGTYGEGSRTTAVVVRKAGGIDAERYADGFGPNTPQRTWSVAKSLAATLVGAAVLSGEHTVSDPIAVGYWLRGSRGEPRNAVTIDHALRMASGRYSDTPGNRTDPLYWGGTTIDERALGWPMVHPPGTVYRYSNNDTLLAIKAIQPYMTYYGASDFLAKAGMHNTVAETDWWGGYMLSSQVWSTARDLAKLGQLYLDNGMYGEERLLPENWRDYVSNPSGPQPMGTQWGYGAGWWTFRRPEGNGFEGIPDDAFAARGNRGQYIVVVPSRDIVIVRRGEDMVGTRFDIAAFTRDVLAALD